ncbi:hypothetical protein Patl1_27816 [Pistacia atlantica]|uniref:Uncharacterized protein n=1 Tax=Pistacia atlantica TaxID=434234 RepID=A0ACC1BCF0_9ROSI|nr:hypothetical protein Patl1_27816 [Pistacia atlantica]
MVDCNCEAALFKSDDRECKMQRLPLTFGRRDMDGGSNNFAFIKEGIVSSSEIEKLTKGFKEEVGRGSSATVYKGNMINCQKFAAVKKLKKVLAEGEKKFLTEIKVIGKTYHRNPIHLLGYSFDGPTKVLVCNGEVELKQLKRVIKVALRSIIDEPSLRPSMKKVLLMLEGTVDTPIPPNPTSYLSCI